MRKFIFAFLVGLAAGHGSGDRKASLYFKNDHARKLLEASPPSSSSPLTLTPSPLGCICNNECGKAAFSSIGVTSDGECDDGGSGAAYMVCFLGSDCDDCGCRPNIGLQSEAPPCLGAGVWKDLMHYQGDHLLAGLRFVSESYPKMLRVVGTDDGKTWWAVSGTCDEPGGVIQLEFSSKGGASDAQGVWVGVTDAPLTEERDNPVIEWPDGSMWERLPKPTPAITANDGVNDHVGVFINPAQYVPGEWTGLRVIVEDPPHMLKVVGADGADAARFWYLEGFCTGDDMSLIHIDFSPKGGPEDLTGTWAWDGSRTITWPHGNIWHKPDAVIKLPKTSPPPPPPPVKKMSEPSDSIELEPPGNSDQSDPVPSDGPGGPSGVMGMLLLLVMAGGAGAILVWNKSFNLRLH